MLRIYWYDDVILYIHIACCGSTVIRNEILLKIKDVSCVDPNVWVCDPVGSDIILMATNELNLGEHLSHDSASSACGIAQIIDQFSC